MTTFAHFFVLEFKRFFSRRNMVVLLLFFLLALYFVNSGIDRYENIIENKEKFREIEQLKVKQYSNYNQYGKYGFGLLFFPSPLSIIFDNSGAFPELTANIDSGDMLTIYRSWKGKTLYDKKAGGFKDFSGIILLLGSLFALYFGFESFRHKEYLKFLSSLLSYKKVFFSVFFSRIILLLLYFLFKTGCALILIRLNDIILSKGEYSHMSTFLLVMFFMLVFFFISGTIIGTFKSRSASVTTIIFLWFFLVFFIPGTIDTIIYKKAESITSGLNLELEKLKTMMEIENSIIDEEGRYNSPTENSEQARELGDSYLNNQIKTLKTFEKKMELEMRDISELCQGLSIFSPATFYLSSGNEVSSRGYNNFIDFYVNVQKLKEQFVRFYVSRVNNSNFAQVESFIKGDENIFYAKSRVPSYFSAGILLHGFYLLLLFFISYVRFYQFQFLTLKKEIPKFSELKIKLEKGKCTTCVTSSPQLRNSVFNFFSGKDKGSFSGKIEIDDRELAGSKEKQDFIYLCHQESIPGDIRTGDFLHFFRRLLGLPAGKFAQMKKKFNLKTNSRKKFSDLDDITKGDILFSLARLKKSEIFLIDEIERGMPQAYTNKLLGNIQALKKEQVIILYLSSNLYFTAKVSERMIIPGDEKIENILK